MIDNNDDHSPFDELQNRKKSTEQLDQKFEIINLNSEDCIEQNSSTEKRSIDDKGRNDNLMTSAPNLIAKQNLIQPEIMSSTNKPSSLLATTKFTSIITETPKKASFALAPAYIRHQKALGSSSTDFIETNSFTVETPKTVDKSLYTKVMSRVDQAMQNLEEGMSLDSQILNPRTETSFFYNVKENAVVKTNDNEEAMNKNFDESFIISVQNKDENLNNTIHLNKSLKRSIEKTKYRC